MRSFFQSLFLVWVGVVVWLSLWTEGALWDHPYVYCA